MNGKKGKENQSFKKILNKDGKINLAKVIKPESDNLYTCNDLIEYQYEYFLYYLYIKNLRLH